MNKRGQGATVSIIVIMSKNHRAIGNNGKLLWHIPDDLKRFKRITLGHPVIMGRKTFESIVSYLGKPLPERNNIVVTRDKDYHYDDVVIVYSLEEALDRAYELDTEKIFIGGGSEIYKQALPYVDKLYLTLVDDEPEADSFFPDYSEFTQVIEREKRDHDGLAYEWITRERM